ncbi:MAG: PEP-CTERM sorting domain-containing protein [Gammaproteobacteria bacterium]|nr:PEP-CTERM sorting domain-containing protein [Gammaproteobacteria bacterium]
MDDDGLVINISPTGAVPEPSVITLLSLGLLGLTFSRRKVR